MMNEGKIISKSLCTQCKHFTCWEDVDVFECEMGRHSELREAEKHNFLTDCEYWEGKI